MLISNTFLFFFYFVGNYYRIHHHDIAFSSILSEGEYIIPYLGSGTLRGAFVLHLLLPNIFSNPMWFPLGLVVSSMKQKLLTILMSI